MFKQHIAKVAFRVNHFTQVQYNQDPTIMGEREVRAQLCPETDQSAPADEVAEHMLHM